jgi:hypothetical protein
MTTRPRQLGRRTAAVLAGFFSLAALSLTTDEVLHILKVYPPCLPPLRAAFCTASESHAKAPERAARCGAGWQPADRLFNRSIRAKPGLVAATDGFESVHVGGRIPWLTTGYNPVP